MNPAAPLSALDLEAIGWEAELRSGATGDDEHRAFAAWCDQSPAHQAAWDALQQRLCRWSGAAAATALRTESADRRHLLRTGFRLAVLGAGGLSARAAWHATGADADLASAIGERRTLALDGGAHVTLDADSRVYLANGSLALARGQLLLRVAPHRPAPVQVAIDAATVSTCGAVLNVGRFAGRCVIAVDSGVATLQRPGQLPLALSGGDALHLDGPALVRSHQSFAAVTAWQRGLFVADRLPLAQLVSVFNRYQRGAIRVTGAAADLAISGVFRLDDVAQALAQVADTLPVEVRRYGAWLTVLR